MASARRSVSPGIEGAADAGEADAGEADAGAVDVGAAVDPLLPPVQAATDTRRHEKVMFRNRYFTDDLC